MKRYIRSSSYDVDRLRFEVDGEEFLLPSWYANESDEEVERVKKLAADSLRDYKNHQGDSYAPIEIDEKSLRRDLRKEGFSRDDCDEIIAMIYDGQTVDSAIQRQLMKIKGEW